MEPTIIFGQDHSPWVQAVLLGAHERGLEYEWKTTPHLSYFLGNGVMMPAVKFPGDAWMKESTDILQKMGYEAVSHEDISAVRAAWRGVTHRTDRALVFLNQFSKATDKNPDFFKRSLRNFLRSYSSFYFLILLKFFAPKFPEPISYGDQFLCWVERLEKSEGEYIGGEKPDSLDMLLFGIIQCHCSIPVPPTESIQSDPQLEKLRSWIGSMQVRFNNYPHLYSNHYIEPLGTPLETATLWDRVCFWLGIIDMTILFPITVPLTVFHILKVRRT